MKSQIVSVILIVPSSSLGSISEAQLKDDQLSKAIKALQNGESLPQKIAPGIFLHDRLLYHQSSNVLHNFQYER